MKSPFSSVSNYNNLIGVFIHVLSLTTLYEIDLRVASLRPQTYSMFPLCCFCRQCTEYKTSDDFIPLDMFRTLSHMILSRIFNY